MNSFDKDAFREFILRLRKTENLSQEKMAEMLGVNEKTVRNWEKGVTIPTMDDVVSIANLFNISLEEIFSGELNSEKEMDRKVSSMDQSINEINDQISRTNENISDIGEDVKTMKDDIGLIPKIHSALKEKNDGASENYFTGHIFELLLFLALGFLSIYFGGFPILSVIAFLLYLVLLELKKK